MLYAWIEKNTQLVVGSATHLFVLNTMGPPIPVEIAQTPV